MRYALINGGTVVNLVIADKEFIENIKNTYQHAEPLDTLSEQDVSIGDSWSISTGFTPQQNFNQPPATPTHRQLSVGAFFDRFGQYKYPILADTNPMVQALIKDASVRTFINLDDPSLVIGLNMIVAAGYDIDVASIINQPITSQESV